eukprot:c9927_g1_i2.p1 GENE.c9927_g1_i2~~c9927_g1_i2.p1  ORF type:complete len:263 (-),score=54.89 c9927_g1_i2:667-1455(-)
MSASFTFLVPIDEHQPMDFSNHHSIPIVGDPSIPLTISSNQSFTTTSSMADSSMYSSSESHDFNCDGDKLFSLQDDPYGLSGALMGGGGVSEENFADDQELSEELGRTYVEENGCSVQQMQFQQSRLVPDTQPNNQATLQTITDILNTSPNILMALIQNTKRKECPSPGTAIAKRFHSPSPVQAYSQSLEKSPDLDGEDQSMRLVQRKERNKEIARKSRLRKKEYVHALEERLRRMEAMQEAASIHVSQLNDLCSDFGFACY